MKNYIDYIYENNSNTDNVFNNLDNLLSRLKNKTKSLKRKESSNDEQLQDDNFTNIVKQLNDILIQTDDKEDLNNMLKRTRGSIRIINQQNKILLNIDQNDRTEDINNEIKKHNDNIKLLNELRINIEKKIKLK